MDLAGGFERVIFDHLLNSSIFLVFVYKYTWMCEVQIGPILVEVNKWDLRLLSTAPYICSMYFRCLCDLLQEKSKESV